MQKIKLSALILAVSLSASAFAGCAKVAEDFIEREPPSEEVIYDQSKENAELLGKYNTHKENSTLAFTTYEKNEKSDFEYEIQNEKVIIKKYIGERDIVVIPDVIDGIAVYELADRAFEGLQVRAVYVPDSVEKIGFAVFSECSKMSTLRLPIVGNGENIDFGGYIFGAEEYFENGLKVPGSLKMILLGENVKKIDENAFFGFKSVEAFVLPGGIESIENFAFNDCRSLVYINFPNTLKSIGQYSFLNCQSLYTIALPESLESVGLGAFMDCSEIRNLTLPFIGNTREENRFIGYMFGATRGEWNESFVPKTLANVTLLGSSVNVPESAFYDCTSLYTVDILDGIESIGVSAFEGCISLVSVNIGASVKTISENAFSGCKSLSKIAFSENSTLSKISMQAFMGCESLYELNFPDSLKRIEKSAFYNCKSITKISARGIEHIGESAFRNCNSINSVSGINKDAVTEKGNSTLLATMN